MSGRMLERRVAVFLSHADPGALRLAGSCALAAAAMGDRVDVYLFGPAVPALVAAHDCEPDEPEALLHQARGAGGCRLVACSASVSVSHLLTTQIVGLPSGRSRSATV